MIRVGCVRCRLRFEDKGILIDDVIEVVRWWDRLEEDVVEY